MELAALDPARALLGGALIGAGVVMLMALNGRIAGISGMIHGLLPGRKGETAWRLSFLAGLFGGSFAYYLFSGEMVSPHGAAPWALIGGGFLVGAGTRLSGGCTAGHGICGLARFSLRSLVATLVFMACGALTVFVARHLLGAA